MASPHYRASATPLRVPALQRDRRSRGSAISIAPSFTAAAIASASAIVSDDGFVPVSSTARNRAGFRVSSCVVARDGGSRATTTDDRENADGSLVRGGVRARCLHGPRAAGGAETSVERWLIDATIAGSIVGIPAWLACFFGAALALAT